jgi:four helix bundle protein
MKERKTTGSFENLRVWQDGCDLAVLIYKLVQEGKISRDYGLKDQMTRAAVSIPANLAEGKERETIPELLRYLYFSKRSAGELRTHLYIAYKIGYLDEIIFGDLNLRAQVLSKKSGSFIRRLKRGKREG